MQMPHQLTSHDCCSEIAHSPEEHGVEEYRFNDGKISPGGVFIGGRMHKTGAEVDGKHSHWYRLEWHKEQGKSRLVQVNYYGHNMFRLWALS